MTMTVAEITGRVNTLLVDTLWLRWPKGELCDYYNDAVRAIILARPDAGATQETVACRPGAQQELPPGALRILDVIRLSDGPALLPVSRETLDSHYPDWHSMTGEPERYVYSELTPRWFWLFPAPAQAINIDAVLSRIPAAVDTAQVDDGTPVAVDEVYVNPLVDWMLYRALSKDTADVSAMARAMQHYRSFGEQMGVRQDVDRFLSQMKQAQSDGQGGVQ